VPSPWPDVSDFVDESWDDEERRLIAGYLSSGVVARAYMGYSPCRVCGQNNGSLEFTDGYYFWPEGFEYYVREHGVRLPDSFVRHVDEMLDWIEGAERNEGWWARAKNT